MANSIDVTLPKVGAALETAFTVTMLREYVTTTLPDSVLQTYLDAAISDVADVAPKGPVNEIIRSQGHGDLVMLAQPAASIISVVENGVMLATDDYEVRSSGQTLRRLATGTHPARGWLTRWFGPIGWTAERGVDVTYIADVDEAARIRAYVALVNLDIAHHPGTVSESIGTWSETYVARGILSYAAERQAIITSVFRMGGGVLIA